MGEVSVLSQRLGIALVCGLAMICTTALAETKPTTTAPAKPAPAPAPVVRTAPAPVVRAAPAPVQQRPAAIQQLQTSGHAKVGFVGRTEDKVEVKVEKPSKPQRLGSSEDEVVFGENVGVRINIKEKLEYPFPKHHVMLIRSIARKFLEQSLEDEVDNE